MHVETEGKQREVERGVAQAEEAGDLGWVYNQLSFSLPAPPKETQIHRHSNPVYSMAEYLLRPTPILLNVVVFSFYLSAMLGIAPKALYVQASYFWAVPPSHS